MFTVFKYFWRGLRNISVIEIALLIFDICIVIAAPRYLFDYYLWTIALICDLGLLIAHGAWLCRSRRARPVSESFPWCRTEGVVMRMLMLIYVSCVILFKAFTGTEIVSEQHLEFLSTYCWYLIVFAAVYECFYCILKTLHAINNDWLSGTSGHIGLPNAVSISRIGIALCVPHIYVMHSFGSESYTVATIILGIALSTDAIDGYIARSMNAITKAGKALDPLGDKLIFYPVTIGFFLATDKRLVQPLDEFPIELVYISAILIILRDVLIVIWYFIFGAKYKDGISAGLADKLRTIILSFWLASTALAITIPETTLGIAMIWISFISLFLAGIASPLSFIIDIHRVMKLKKDAKNQFFSGHLK
jgi:CDP-diacylglycerol--glycerol-3-phosphate 3-phosphatidyltransferase